MSLTNFSRCIRKNIIRLPIGGNKNYKKFYLIENFINNTAL